MLTAVCRFEEIIVVQSQGIALSSSLLVGRNHKGQWVVQDDKRVRGGLFVNRAEALKYALFETGGRPQAVIMVPGLFELDMSGVTSHRQDPIAGGDASYTRRAA